MTRVLVVGPCGAGKSILAQRLGELLDLPVVHLDRLNWNPGWIDTPAPLWRQKVQQAVRAPRWVIDGNYGGTLDLRLPSADTVIFLDMPRWRCVCRVIKRIIRYAGRTRPDMGEGCPERWDWEFMEYVWHYHAQHRPKLLARLAMLPRDKRLIVLRAPAEVQQLIADIEWAKNNSPQNAY